MADIFEFDVGDAAEPTRDITQYMTGGNPYQSHKVNRSSSSKAHLSPQSTIPNPNPNPHFKKTKWTPEEDQCLMESVNKHGMGNWSLVSQGVPGRTGKQCRERWINQLCPALCKDNWTPQEDQILIQQQQIHGNFWTKIAQYLPGRSANNIKNRWSWLTRHRVSPTIAAQILPILMLKQQQSPMSGQYLSPDQSMEFQHNPLIHQVSSPVPHLLSFSGQPQSQPKLKPPMPMINYPEKTSQLSGSNSSSLIEPVQPNLDRAFSDPYDVNLSFSKYLSFDSRNDFSEPENLKLSFDDEMNPGEHQISVDQRFPDFEYPSTDKHLEDWGYF